MDDSQPVPPGVPLRKVRRYRQITKIAESDLCNRLDDSFRDQARGRYRDASLSDLFADNCKGRLSVAEAARLKSWAARTKDSSEGGFLVLHGDEGLGKTHMAVALGAFLVRRRVVRGVFVSWTKLMQELSFGDLISETEYLINAPILVLDDVGSYQSDGMTNHQARAWRTVVDERYSIPGLITIMPTNLPLQSEGGVMGLQEFFGEPVWKRILEDGEFIEFKGKSFR